MTGGHPFLTGTGCPLFLIFRLFFVKAYFSFTVF
ncbi:MAG TPA: hypothetical protein DHV15_04475 [Treponema sp.]|uniref:Uncharacterized protein n=1 Tax=Treponema denticola (strain ATCC 35405 / DSM 14222 / CIP 103919 / JCM 8153 / KCTC 15104) TaxID=243275 RepID=Q73KM0_TREDE|nr:hypothetical protein TDE_2197 [Treponema denticola ATCC 35405]HCY94755.1 hypothetical protein [Treponema sp.]